LEDAQRIITLTGSWPRENRCLETKGQGGTPTSGQGATLDSVSCSLCTADVCVPVTKWWPCL
jgi:hypothetical protein